jgi:hypothetical protein
MLARQWNFEQRIILKIDLANGEIVRSAPVGIHPIKKSEGERGRRGDFRECCGPR